MIRLDHVCKSYGKKAVLVDLSLSLPEKGFCAVTGRSGSGKTTLLYLIAGLSRPDSGSVLRSGERISMVFQEDRLLPWETALQNASIAAPREMAAAILTELGLGADLDRYPRQLSGGMSRRTAIARALAAEAEVYIMDEPLKGLDAGTKAAALCCIRRRTEGKLLIMVTHDPDETAGADLLIEL